MPSGREQQNQQSVFRSVQQDSSQTRHIGGQAGWRPDNRHYIPYYVGGNHQLAVIEAAKALLRATGHDSADGPWIPLGVGVHCGNAFVGTVGSHDAATDIAVLDDAPNTAARLSSAAAAGETMLSGGAYDIAGLTDDPERRKLELKGKSEAMGVRGMTDISK